LTRTEINVEESLLLETSRPRVAIESFFSLE
jgi:hypothetical protein